MQYVNYFFRSGEMDKEIAPFDFQASQRHIGDMCMCVSVCIYNK